MTAAISLAFFDPANQLYGTVRNGLTLLFEGTRSSGLADAAELSREEDRYRARVDDRLDLSFEPISSAADFHGASTQVCRVAGAIDGRRIDCLGTATETTTPPAWEELDALRSISALFDADLAVLALARRPRGSLGHGEELVTGHLLTAGSIGPVESARISTVYDGGARQRSASLELWLPGQDFPRRAAGTVLAGTTLELEGLRVNAAVFSWQMDGRKGVGAYDVLVREQEPAAA